ncbi:MULTISPECIES: hypothetical protein [Blautia]|uniref:Uncharacterized protein n=1 Tax=Blautia aquisgranensis TaxID=3133153 RepID=A0ABV1BK90_9FIRM|nr:hypothetical protein [Blautia luti]
MSGMVFGVPHCGARGSNNISGYDKMKNIWKEMKKRIVGNY